MALIDLATNVIFPISLVIFVFGLFYNIIQYFVIPGAPKSYSPSRDVGLGRKIAIPIVEWPKKFWFIVKKSPLHVIASVFFFHIPVLVLIFLFGPHQIVLFNLLPFLSPILRPLRINQQITDTYIVDRSIWGSLDILFNADTLSLVLIFGLTIILFYRIVKHLSGEFKSTIGDYFVLLLVLSIITFGFLAVHSTGTGLYQVYLFLHISTASLLIAFIPYSKFFHFTWSYWVNVIKTIYHDVRKGI